MVAGILEKLESFHGPQEPGWPTDPYLFLVWWHSGYPASDAACDRGWESLKKSVGVRPDEIRAAPQAKLAKALAPGGMVPDLRAMRLKQIAERIQSEFGGELRLDGPLPKIRKLLKSFPNIGDPGADRILLFADIAPLAAIPSNCPHVLVRILHGQEHENYGTTYREAQSAIDLGVAKNLAARKRAYLLLKRHGQEICKRTKPKCDECPLAGDCAFKSGKRRGRASSIR